MEEVCRHAYVAPETEERFPTASLAQLVHAFRVWEAQGGDRRSLFAEGGAPGMRDDFEDVVLDWNFSTAVEADVDEVLDASDHGALPGAYGTDVDEEPAREEATPRRRRRRPPRQIAVKSPLEKVFDANTLSNYDEYSRQYYAKFLPAPPVQQALLHSDLPVADRESIIDLDLCLVDNNLSGGTSDGGSAFNSVDLGVGTMRPVTGSEEEEAKEQDLGGTKRATQDWKFPFAFCQPAVEDGGFLPPCWDEAASDASHSRSESFDSLIDLDMSAAPPTSVASHQTYQRPCLREPPPPLAPLPQVLMGQAGDEQVKAELYRMTASLTEHLSYTTMCLADMQIGRGYAGAKMADGAAGQRLPPKQKDINSR
ncbi:serine/threonine protein kinase [Cordyceps fumosorosea ARSEF 2679]|uniref:Serine/threonine protein kinase n=1 Tax=Cordyceps fumosorosea (strain ARSEF 2679) TaxID=1081104 RepID=A0A162LKW1_CORFA|nr:serine/threonine protein kinase [Cordyceps fumosorosea ARSEF 2679]OAA72084.1 serine/threonine protein kinase [Cordyceps fumosorosea ARSEF 2679]